MLQKLNSAVAVIGIDIGKSSFHIVGHDKHAVIVPRQKWSQALHRVRERLVSQRTGIINQIRAFLLKRGGHCRALGRSIRN
jgi:hypothetical protein